VDYFTYLADHWFVGGFLSFCAILLVGHGIDMAFKAINRVLRTIKVVCRGWPPGDLDADGDFRPLAKAAK
jgi:hypothetical protein